MASNVTAGVVQRFQSAFTGPNAQGVATAVTPAAPVTWTSSDPAIATVASDGLSTCTVTPIKAGTVTLTAAITASAGNSAFSGGQALLVQQFVIQVSAVTITPIP